MRKKLTSLEQLRAAAVEARGLIAQVAGTAAEAIEELAERTQDAAAAVTMEQVAAAIESAVTAAMEEAY